MTAAVGTPAPDSLEELTRKVADHECWLRDHEQRFETLQTNYLRRLWWYVRWGWSLVDLNAGRPAWRPWNRSRRPGP